MEFDNYFSLHTQLFVFKTQEYFFIKYEFCPQETG